MLKDCLRSLMVQQTPSHVRLTIVVVENDEESRCRWLVEEMARQHGAPRIVYGHEPEIGIPFARNRSLELALEHDADWIGFIDDDEIASPDWIAKLVAAAAALDADVLQGPVEAIYPPQTSHLVQKAAKRRPTGSSRGTAYTNNTLMRASIARKEGLGLRFDEAMRFTGGSDVEFFSRAVAHGAVIRWVDEAVVSESVPMARLTLRWQLERARRTGANHAYLDAQRNGVARAVVNGSVICLGKIASACIELPVGLVVYPLNARLGSRIALRALRKLSWSAGNLGTALRIRPQPYLRVEGN
jgi:succinoglycan biosynthesis protein ExoM